MRDDILTIRAVWMTGYQRLLAEERASGRVEQRPADHERRADPRLRVVGQNILAPALGPVLVTDLSIHGLALRSPTRVRAHDAVPVSLANVFSTETTVVDCTPIPLTGGDSHLRYSVRLRFNDPEHGLQFVTLALELDRIERD